jgi:catechol 2,3-dioxygenase-like lactoylglutathione lyase family enzyme
MLDHTGINVSDFERSKAFYRAALAPLGYRLLKETGLGAGFGVLQGHGRSLDPAGDFWIAPGAPLVPRLHVAFSAASRGAVDAFFERTTSRRCATRRPTAKRSPRETSETAKREWGVPQARTDVTAL